ncbi:MAG: hypothetical protein O3C10_09855 [Chloroflexi bacterium]|nr:hypothetical protein [Chloroflexota bacterium]
MGTLSYEVELTSDQGYGTRLPSAAIGSFLVELQPAVRDSIRMAVEHRAVSRGKVPEWLAASSDIRFIGHGGTKNTVLHFEANQLGESAEEIYAQQELWASRPDPDDTGFDLLGDVLTAVRHEERDSDRFDSDLLRRLERFNRIFNKDFSSMTFRPDGDGHRHEEVVLDSSLLATAKALRSSSPPPQQVRVVGELDMIRASTRTFAVKLDDGTELKANLNSGTVVDLAEELSNRVTVIGQAIFKPSGRVLRIDADFVSSDERELSLWSIEPLPVAAAYALPGLRQTQGPRSGLNAIVGAWPGDESDEEIAAALERMS